VLTKSIISDMCLLTAVSLESERLPGALDGGYHPMGIGIRKAQDLLAKMEQDSKYIGPCAFVAIVNGITKIRAVAGTVRAPIISIPVEGSWICLREMRGTKTSAR